jgi:putative FmdB family regulatory protein
MPTYEYACVDCGTHVEVYQRFSDESLTTCGVCGGRLRKVFHPAGIMFKGAGFYKTDSRSGSAPSEGGSKGSEGGKSSGASKESKEKTGSGDAKGKSA